MMLKLRRNAALLFLLLVVGALAPVSALADENPIGEATDSAEQAAQGATDGAEQTADGAADTAEQAAEQTSDTVEQAAEQTTDSVQQATDSAEQTAEGVTDSAEQTAEGVTDSVQQTTNSVQQAAGGATGTAEQTTGTAEQTTGTAEQTAAGSTGTAAPGISQEASPMGTPGGVAPAGASVAFGVSQGIAHSWDRSMGDDSDQPFRFPSQLLAEVVQAGNQITTASPRNKEAERFDLAEWLPGWLPSLLAMTGVSVLVLIGIAVFFIHGGAAALALSRRGGRPAADHEVATTGVVLP